MDAVKVSVPLPVFVRLPEALAAGVAPVMVAAVVAPPPLKVNVGVAEYPTPGLVIVMPVTWPVVGSTVAIAVAPVPSPTTVTTGESM